MGAHGLIIMLTRQKRSDLPQIRAKTKTKNAIGSKYGKPPFTLLCLLVPNLQSSSFYRFQFDTIDRGNEREFELVN